MLVEREYPLMVLRKYRLDEPLSTDSTREELEHLIAEQGDGKSHTWGYFPEMNPDKDKYPECIDLAKQIEEEVLMPHSLSDSMNLQLAFVRLATDEPESDFGGMHIDVNRGIGHEWPDAIDWQNHHIIRTLFNVGESPRNLEFADVTVKELREAYNQDVARDKYEPLDLPDKIPTQTVAIPPLEPDAIHCVVFISSLIPHAGRTSGSGHFLVSHGGYILNEKVPTVFQ